MGRSHVNVKVEPRSTFTFTCGLSYISSISFMYGKIARQWKSTLSPVLAPLSVTQQHRFVAKRWGRVQN